MMTIMIQITPKTIRSRDGSIYIATGYGLEYQGLISDRGLLFIILYGIQIGFGAHSTSYPMGTGSSFTRGISFIQRQKKM
jgi:hypothetical protein